MFFIKQITPFPSLPNIPTIVCLHKCNCLCKRKNIHFVISKDYQILVDQLHYLKKTYLNIGF